MLVETQIEIFDGQSSYLFSNELLEKRPGTTIEDFGLHSVEHFESRERATDRFVAPNFRQFFWEKQEKTKAGRTKIAPNLHRKSSEDDDFVVSSITV